MHLLKDPGILALCNIPMAISMIVRVASRSAVAEACALVSKRSPHLSLLHVGLCSQQQQASAADTGGGGEVGGGACGSNDVTQERLQPVLD